MNNIINLILEHLETYRALLEERHRLLEILEKYPDDKNTFDQLYDLCITIENLGIRHAIPEDLEDTGSLRELIEILQKQETTCLTDAIQLCRVKKLLRLS